MTTKTTTRRTAKVSLSAVADAEWDETIEIPDDVRPEDVDEWIAEYVAGYRFGDVVHWDNFDIDREMTTITGTWQPEEGTEEYEAWLEAERLRPIPGQTDIFGGVVDFGGAA